MTHEPGGSLREPIDVTEKLAAFIACPYLTAELESERTSTLIRVAAHIDALAPRDRTRDTQYVLLAIETELASREPWPPSH
jgi:hypothetical protein